MKTITKYQASDGTEWTTEAECLNRDALFAKVNAAMAPLGETLPGVKEGKGWFQHDPETVLTARDAIINICREEGFANHWDVFKRPGREIHPRSIVGRILDDNPGPLRTAWGRFCRIDEQGREHEQPYFAINGPASEHVCVGIAESLTKS